MSRVKGSKNKPKSLIVEQKPTELHPISTRPVPKRDGIYTKPVRTVSPHD